MKLSFCRPGRYERLGMTFRADGQIKTVWSAIDGVQRLLFRAIVADVYSENTFSSNVFHKEGRQAAKFKVTHLTLDLHQLQTA